MSAALALCFVASVLDGDTFTCWGGARIRIARIDAPELSGHCRRGRDCAPGDPQVSREALRRLLWPIVTYQPVVADPRRPERGYRSYGRIVARVWSNGREVGPIMIKQGFARSWP
jgi:micrococcal nuclease